eukprot:m.260141 g.260141  ORF g.260141 m.260141 type:complete len:62 (+) comp19676_c0_seq1:2589-2774(+)
MSRIHHKCFNILGERDAEATVQCGESNHQCDDSIKLGSTSAISHLTVGSKDEVSDVQCAMT